MNPLGLRTAATPDAALQPEVLEIAPADDRRAGNTFAIIPGTIATANQKVTGPVHASTRAYFTLTRSTRSRSGIDVAAADRARPSSRRSSSVDDLQTHQIDPDDPRDLRPRPSSATSPASGKQTTAVLVTLRLIPAQAASRRTPTPSSSRRRAGRPAASSRLLPARRRQRRRHGRPGRPPDDQAAT